MNWNTSTGTAQRGQHTNTWRKRNQTCTANIGKYTILCLMCGHASLCGFKLNCSGTNESNRENNKKMHSTSWLLGKQCKCKGKISCVGYDNEHTLWRIVTFRIKSAKQSLWTLLHGMDAKGLQTNQNKWSVLHQYNNNEIWRGVSSRSRTGSPIP